MEATFLSVLAYTHARGYLNSTNCLVVHRSGLEPDYKASLPQSWSAECSELGQAQGVSQGPDQTSPEKLKTTQTCELNTLVFHLKYSVMLVRMAKPWS